MPKAREPVVTYRAAPRHERKLRAGTASESTAKLFANGRSQAVRLPKEFRMPGTEVRIHREGDRIILEPILDVPRDSKGWPIGFWERIHAEAAGLDDTWVCPADPVPEPIAAWDDEP